MVSIKAEVSDLILISRQKPKGERFRLFTRFSETVEELKKRSTCRSELDSSHSKAPDARHGDSETLSRDCIGASREPSSLSPTGLLPSASCLTFAKLDPQAACISVVSPSKVISRLISA